MTKAIHAQKLDTVIVLVIFCVFAASVLMVLMLSGNIYKNTAEMSNEKYSERTTLSYIWSKVKNMDEASGIYVYDFGGVPSLCFEETLGGVKYRTLIYCYEGVIKELFYDAAQTFSPGSGMTILEAESLTFEQLEDGLIKVISGDNSVFISPRSGGV